MKGKRRRRPGCVHEGCGQWVRRNRGTGSWSHLLALGEFQTCCRLLPSRSSCHLGCSGHGSPLFMLPQWDGSRSVSRSRPCRPVLTTNAPSRARHQPRSNRTAWPGRTRSTSSPQSNRPTTPARSRAQAAAMGPVYFRPETWRGGYRRSTIKSKSTTGRSGSRSAVVIFLRAMTRELAFYRYEGHPLRWTLNRVAVGFTSMDSPLSRLPSEAS